MREIKFRAWIKSQKRMDYHLTVNFDSSLIITNFGTYSFSEIELMQYTGLRDKWGKEIYERDITESMSWIDWCDKCCSFGLFLVNFGCAGCKGDAYWQEIVQDKYDIEIIGNIYENIKLLGGD